MKVTEYFYRIPGTVGFKHCGSEKIIVPVRLKNDFCKDASYYSFSENEWKSFDGNVEALNARLGDDFFPAELVNTPVEPSGFVFQYDPLMKFAEGGNGDFDIEDLDVSQMKDYLEQRYEFQKFHFDTRNFNDSRGIEKDYYGTRVEYDEENLTLKISALHFVRDKKKNSSEEKLESYNFNPKLDEDCILYDIKNGKVDIDVKARNDDGNEAGIKADRKDKKDFYKFGFDVATLAGFCKGKISRDTLSFIFEKFIFLAGKFTGISYECFIKQKRSPLIIMYKITMLPYEPMLYQVLKSMSFIGRKKKFSYRRTDANVFKKFCRKMKIKNTRVLRRCYLERPEVLITSMNICECGFKDINLFNRVLENPEYSGIFDGIDLKPLVFFSRYAIKKRGQLAAMNLILKGGNGSYEKSDGIEMFAQYFKYVPETLRADILKDGFTRFNHDALSNISYQAKNENCVFEYSANQKKLEDKIGAYEFLLPKDSYQLCEIGTALHNCVASYADKIKSNDCTIVYAQKDGAYKICIEVCENEIKQELTDHNEMPSEEETKILGEWHLRHGLVN